ncbi:MAG: hypothetical protein DRQ44_11060 [Gammaproteobacteria bacterium]|nr:MAG: hypothetical protein DRQ44_11060 [Gammaproteobacteria bacterium]
MLRLISGLMLVFLMVGCATVEEKPSMFDSFKAQSCLVIYCESSENSRVKKAGLKLVEIAFATQGADIKLGRGVCERYYFNREPAGGYVYAKKSAYEVCKAG